MSRPPDVAALSRVRVHGMDAADCAEGGAVLRHVQVVDGLGEPRRLVGVEDHHPDRRLVLEGPFPYEPGVNDRVRHFHGKSIRITHFVIQKL